MRRSFIAVSILCCAIGAARADQKPAPTKGTDFADEVRTLYRIAACGGDDSIPERFTARTIDLHCKEMAEVYKSYRKAWADQAEKFIADLRPKDIPKTVVYPFGGGDLTSALAVYPDATEYTTLSLEGMGDPRPVTKLTAAKPLAAALAKLNELFQMNLSWAWNTTIQLSIDSSDTTGGLPGILSLTLVALDANGY